MHCNICYLSCPTTLRNCSLHCMFDFGFSTATNYRQTWRWQGTGKHWTPFIGPKCIVYIDLIICFGVIMNGYLFGLYCTSGVAIAEVCHIIH